MHSSSRRIDAWEVVQHQKAARYFRAIALLRAASLPPRRATLSEAVRKKQETPPVATDEVSTAHTWHQQEVRAAGAHSATYTPL